LSEPAATDVLFYHLERQPLEAVLPTLIEKTLERGWRAVVQSGSQERLDAIDETLWTYKPDSFLAHGSARDPSPDAQPIYLTTGTETPNGAGVRFLIEGAELQAYSGFVRIVILFNGLDSEAVAQARAQWKTAKAQGCGVAYWQQNDTGRWEKKA